MARSLFDFLSAKKESMQSYDDSNGYLQDINNIFMSLHSRMHRFHNAGMLPDISSRRIYEVIAKDGSREFAFINEIGMDNREPEALANTKQMIILQIGALLTSAPGIPYEDYTDSLSSKYNIIVQNFDQVASIINGMTPEGTPEYFKEVLINDNILYYDEFMQQHREKQSNDASQNIGQGQSKAPVKSYATAAGKATMPSGHQQNSNTSSTSMSAFINVIFYPTLLFLITLIFIVIYNCYLFLNK